MKPIFFDIETEDLYYKTSVIQLKPLGEPVEIIRINSDEDIEKFKSKYQNKHLVGYNLAYDFGTLNWTSNTFDDLYYAIKIAIPQIQEFSLDKVASYFNLPFYQNIDKKLLQKKGFKRDEVLTQEQLQYIKSDVEILEYLYPTLFHIFKHPAYQLGIKALKQAIQWQMNGLPVDRDKVDKLYQNLKALMTLKKFDVLEEIGLDINIDSPKQIKDYFNLPKADRAELLKHQDNPVIANLLEYRKVKTKLTKLERFRDLDRVYGKFNPLGTRTSRWSCNGVPKDSPLKYLQNLQNYPREFKDIFKLNSLTFNSLGPNDTILIGADYPTLELRIATEYMREDNLYKALKEGKDLHTATAQLITGKSDITPEERQQAKICNFGLTYGMGINTLRQYAFELYNIKWTPEQTKDLYNKFFKAYPNIKKYHNKVTREVKIVYTALGYPIIPKGYSEAINAPIQGTGGEIGRVAIDYLITKHPESINYIINFIHDAIYLEVPIREEAKYKSALKEAMEYAWEYISQTSNQYYYRDIPCPIEVNSGKSIKDL